MSRVETGAGWTMYRRPNYGFRCAQCGAVRELYLRPSYAVPSFCSRSCAVAHRFTDPAERERQARRGEDHYAWSGADVSVKGGRTRALRAYPKIGPCVACGAARAERHHVDGNTANNEPANVRALCRRCHMASDGRLEAFREKAKIAQPMGVAARWRRA